MNGKKKGVGQVHTPLSVNPFRARPKISSSLVIRRPSLIYHHCRSRYSQNYYRHHSYFHTQQLSYRSYRVHECSNVNPSNMYRDQGVNGDSQSGFSDYHQKPGVRYEREEERLGRGVEHANNFSRGMRRDAGSQTPTASSSAPTSNSKSETFMSPYGDYDMDDTSFFAHTTRLNIIGPNPAQFPRRRSSSTERLFKYGDKSMDTAASFNKTNRSRSLSPVGPLIPGKRTSPTESYLQQSLQSSLPLADPTASRKLLVLDLNGTLLLRSTHSGRRAPAFPFSHIHHSNDDSHSSSTSPRTTPRPNPALRTVYPRPYLPSFCAYVFHPTTLQWLDTMVWSSAQPHSVNDMVDKCFGTYKEGLKAIWARDTLGLSNDEYCEYIYAAFFG